MGAKTCEDREEVHLDNVTQVTCQDACLERGEYCSGISCSAYNYIQYPYYDCTGSCFVCKDLTMVDGIVDDEVFIKKPAFCDKDKECPDEAPICNEDKVCIGCHDDTDCTSARPICENQSATCKDVEYPVLTNTYCSHYGSFDDLNDALSSCSHDLSCVGVLDDYCDELGTFYLCEIGTNTGHGGYCVYNKKVPECRMDNECTNSSIPHCFDYSCVECGSNEQCSDGLVCNMQNHTCGTVYVIDCESPYGVITSPGTTVISPNYPDFYGESLLCETTITFDSRVSLTFESFAVGIDGGSFCDSDWLEVRDGDNSESEMIGDDLCGNHLPDAIASTGKSITLVFYTNRYSYYYDTGFKITALPV